MEWVRRNRPDRLERRFDFKNYQETRDFLDRLGEFSEKKKRFPDISFGKTYANITIRPESEDKDASLKDLDLDLAEDIDSLAG